MDDLIAIGYPREELLIPFGNCLLIIIDIDSSTAIFPDVEHAIKRHQHTEPKIVTGSTDIFLIFIKSTLIVKFSTLIKYFPGVIHIAASFFDRLSLFLFCHSLCFLLAKISLFFHGNPLFLQISTAKITILFQI